ncbi:hypothetical protein [Frigoribacterium faeni]|uniref:Uncharacterized protein n=1 Tax=Frigoribacterium faeni TaxID=145483 RepID=A0A7W3JKF3_9MICO|nr:hypothetical protein [Frigoribacterium faeni]MBA8814492.1 hypothetical protein [Frigoribacterium faeni]GEK84303.1 hypothetical protein FFA01_26120 [Frigoribacterium faeni]
MKRIHYADEYIVTGDDIADAVMAYARGLALKGRSDSVELPALTPEGEVGRFQVLLGPASQMVVSGEPDSLVVIEDADLVADLRARIDGLEGPSARPSSPGERFPDMDAEQYPESRAG